MLKFISIMSLFLMFSVSFADEVNCNKKRYIPTQEEFTKILKNHETWLDTVINKDVTHQLYANLCGYDLENADLTDVDLSYANLSNTYLMGANLTSANLERANLSNSFLMGANLKNADLTGANLTNAAMSSRNITFISFMDDEIKPPTAIEDGITNLENADLNGANLTDVRLTGAYLKNVNFSEAILINVSFTLANLKRADFSNTNASNADFDKANLYRADLSRANLSNADLTKANLNRADLSRANLSNADLTEADLTKSDLTEANLTGTNFNNTTLTGSNYQPSILGVPNLDSLIGNITLFKTNHDNPRGLIAIREVYLKYGLTNEARKLTQLIKHTQNEKRFKQKENVVLGYIEGAFNFIFFEWTTNWGMEPRRALIILLFGIFMFMFFYLAALQTPDAKDGIWYIRADERILDKDKDDKELIKPNGFWATIPIAVYFSLLSAFHFGWKDLNVGSWIHRLQHKEYTLRATGWVRTVAGIQSLFSVYLVAIWALTYFGRPFD